MSSLVGRALNFEIVEAALKDFGHTVACAGKRIFEGGSVRLLKEGDRPNTFEGEVADDNEKSKTHHVILAYGGTAWNLLCTCSMGAECKHCYAALLFLSKRFKKVEIASEKPEPSPKKARDFFALVADPAKLTERQTDFVERLDDFYQTHQDGDKVNGRVLKALFPKWPEADYWLEIPIAPRIKLSRLQFWHFLVVNLQAQKLPIPDYFGESNDTSASADLIDKRVTKSCRGAQPRISKLYSLRTIPNRIASRWDRYHPARQLASTRWVPANTQKRVAAVSGFQQRKGKRKCLI